MALPALPSPGAGSGPALTAIEKAAVIFRLLQAEGAAPSLEMFDSAQRSALESGLERTRSLEEAAISAVVDEFIQIMRAAAKPRPALPQPKPLPDLGFPEIAPLDFASAKDEEPPPDPWRTVLEQDDDALVAILMAEAPEIGAVLLSKIKVGHAAALLSRVAGPLARRIAYAVSRTSAISPDIVALIGEALGAQFSGPPPRAFESGPVERVGAILNSSRASTRNEVLTGLDETDPEFAEAVRRAIFTFANIPARVDKRDIPKILRRIEHSVLVTAIAAAQSDQDLNPAAEFLLEALPQRMRDAISEDIGDLGDARGDTGEDAMAEIVGAIRKMEEAGEIYLVANEDT